MQGKPSNMPIRLLEPIAEVGALSYLYLHLHLQPAAAGLSLPDPTPERIAYVLGLALFAGFYGGKIYKDFLGTKSKAITDYQDIREIKASLSAIERQLEHNRSDIEKDLIARRAMVDKEITVLNLGGAAWERRAAMIESRHNRLRDAFSRLTGSLAPVLKDMDVDLSRIDIVSRLIGTAHDLPNDASDEGNET